MVSKPSDVSTRTLGPQRGGLGDSTLVGEGNKDAFYNREADSDI